MIKDRLGDRMKDNYEDCFRIILPKFMPIIIRLDGVAFHTLTKKMKKPFDSMITSSMQCTALRLCHDIGGAVMAYVQSDEISLLVYPYNSFESQEWHGNNLQKLVSISASIASVEMTRMMEGYYGAKNIIFDSRAFVIPMEEVNNYFVWRQKDWQRNSVNMIAQSIFSHKKLHGVNLSKAKEMIKESKPEWAIENWPNYVCNGCAVVKIFDEEKGQYVWEIDTDGTPDFVENKEYIQYRMDKIIINRESNGYIGDFGMDIKGFGLDMSIFDDVNSDNNE